MGVIFFLYPLACVAMISSVCGVPAADRRLLQDTCEPYVDLWQQMGASEAEVSSFINGMDGTVILLGQPQYPKARNYTFATGLPYNTRVPLLVVYCRSEADVAATVALAASKELPLCVRAGGHDTAGRSICTGGVVLDISYLNQMMVHPERGYAHVQAGARFRQIEDTLTAYGLSAVAGLCPGVGIAGYTLGGGWGMFSKLAGMGSDNILEMTVALPSGELVMANQTNEHADLFWAMRGAGHNNFGVMTSLKYRTLPQAESIILTLTFPLEDDPAAAAAVLLRWQDEYLDKQPMALTCNPVMPQDPATLAVLLTLFCMYAGEGPAAEAEALALLQPLADLGATNVTAQRMGLNEMAPAYDAATGGHLGCVLAAAAESGRPPAWEYKYGQYVQRPLSLDEFGVLVAGLIASAHQPGLLDVFSYLEPYEGAITAVDPAATAFVHRAVGFDVVTDVFFDPSGAQARTDAREWLDELYYNRWAGLLSAAAYQNYPSEAYGGARALRLYYGDNLCRLVQVKRRYDPGNVFSYEQGVPLQSEGCP